MKVSMLVAIFLFITCIPLVNALSIGVSPGKVNFNNMLRNGYAERILRISTDSTDTVSVRYELEGNLDKWLTFEPSKNPFMASRDNPYSLKIVIKPLSDAGNGNYSAKIRFVTDSISDINSRAGSFVKVGVTFVMNIEIVDKEVKSCTAGGFSFDDIEVSSPLDILFYIKNDGNTRINPFVRFDVWDQYQNKLVFSDDFFSSEVLPTTQGKTTKSITHKMEIGQYWVDVFVDECKFHELLTFNVLEKGSIIDKGVLEMITNKVWAYVDEPVDIVALFRNNGPRAVSAQFKGDVRLNNKIVKILESDEIEAPAGNLSEIITYFTPDQPGRYLVSGRVIYNKKLTFEKSSIINVNYIESPTFSAITLMIYLIILFVVIFLIRKVRKTIKEKNRYK